jgi:hypothetical protein
LQLSKKIKAYWSTPSEAENAAAKSVLIDLLKTLSVEVKIEGEPHRKLKENVE